MPETLLQIDRLRVVYGEHRGWLRKRAGFAALDDVSLAVERGEALGIVGESGAGKSTLARCVAGLQQPTSGELRFRGQPLDSTAIRSQRAIQMVFQDPYSSLNPRMTIGDTLTELLRVHGLAATPSLARSRAADVLETVGLPESALDLRPRAFSGGQRQRIAIARALVLEPSLLLADEPVSSLDVSVQASILLLLKELQKAFDLTIVFISHDLAVVHQFCSRVAVMRDGKLIELGETGPLFAEPGEAYTRELLAAATQLPVLEVPSMIARHPAPPSPAPLS